MSFDNFGLGSSLSLVGNEQLKTVRARQGVTLLRPVFMNAVEVGYSYAHCDRDKKLNVRGVTIALWYFICRGHQAIALLPYCFKNYAEKSSRYSELMMLYRLNLIEFTPGYGSEKYAEVNRIMVNRAHETGGCIVARSQMQGITDNKANLVNVVEQRLLMPTFNGDDIMFPIDGPLGRNGPTLKQTLECEQGSSDWRACSEHQLLYSDQKHWLEKLSLLVPEKTNWHRMNQLIQGSSEDAPYCEPTDNSDPILESNSYSHSSTPPQNIAFHQSNSSSTICQQPAPNPFNRAKNPNIFPDPAPFPSHLTGSPPTTIRSFPPINQNDQPIIRREASRTPPPKPIGSNSLTRRRISPMDRNHQPHHHHNHNNHHHLNQHHQQHNHHRNSRNGHHGFSKHSATTDSIASSNSSQSCGSRGQVADMNSISPIDIVHSEELLDVPDEFMFQLQEDEERRQKEVEQRKNDELLAKLSQIFGYSKSSRVMSKFSTIKNFCQLVEKCIHEKDQEGDEMEFVELAGQNAGSGSSRGGGGAVEDLIDFSTDVHVDRGALNNGLVHQTREEHLIDLLL